MSEKYSLSDLVDVVDDLDVSVDPDTYQDQASPAPLVAGNYRGRVIDHGPRLDFETKQPKKTPDGYPFYVLNGIELVDGVENAPRKVYPFKEIQTKPFERLGVLVSGLGDINRAFDQTRRWSGLKNGLALLNEFLEEGALFTAAYNWEAFDKEFADSAIEQLGHLIENAKTDPKERALRSAIYGAARIQGMNKFLPTRNGHPDHMFPRGNVTFKNPTTGADLTVEVAPRFLEAKLVITRFYPSGDDKVKLGPFAYKAPKALLVAA
jgi:hypothetical protein